MQEIRIVVNESGEIVNRIVVDYDDETHPEWHPGEGLTLIDHDGDIGGTHIGGVYRPPPPTPLPENSQ